MRKNFLRLGSFLAFLAVILGAFGAHGLKSHLEVEQIATFETGVRYQFYHSFAILIVALLLHFRKKSYLPGAAWFFFAGIVCFSGSLYAFTFGALLNIKIPFWVGPVTPIGGICFIIGWALIFLSTFQNGHSNGNGSNGNKD